MTLNDVQVAVRLASMEEKYNDGQEHSFDSDKNQDEQAEKMACNFDDLQGNEYPLVTALLVIRELCMKYNVVEHETLVAAESNIETKYPLSRELSF